MPRCHHQMSLLSHSKSSPSTSVLSPWRLERELLTLVSQMESVVRVLYAKGTSLNLRSKKINEVPECVSRLTNLSALRLNNNSISALPAALRSLRHVSVCVRCELICSLEIFQDDSLNVLHTTQICD